MCFNQKLNMLCRLSFLTVEKVAVTAKSHLLSQRISCTISTGHEIATKACETAVQGKRVYKAERNSSSGKDSAGINATLFWAPGQNLFVYSDFFFLSAAFVFGTFFLKKQQVS